MHPADISWLQLAAAAALVLVAVALSQWQQLGLARQLLSGAARATVQLLATGYVLVWVFATEQWWVVAGLLLVMVMVASHTAASRQKIAVAARRRVAALTGFSILVGSAITLVYVMGVIVHVEPWYDPRYVIPLAGMVIANAMNAAALGAERLRSELVARAGEVEAWLALGATPAQASAEPVRRAVSAAMMPTINGLAVVGIVSLPGMMTGQILAGASPLLAVRYQLVVVFMLACATAITALLVVLAYRRSFFTAADQFRRPLD